MIVWIASYPRSGNSFFRILLKHIYGQNSYSLHNDALIGNMGASEIIGHEKLPVELDELAETDELHFIKTHFFPPDGGQAIYLIRDGRDVCVSFADFQVAFKQRSELFARVKKIVGINDFERALKRIILGRAGFGSWSNHAMGWTDQREVGRTVVVRYEDLIVDPIGQVNKSLDSLNLNLLPRGDQVPSFEELHSKWPNFFRRGIAGSWREKMSEESHELFWQNHGEVMVKFGYER
jgi:hypothetical protein